MKWKFGITIFSITGLIIFASYSPNAEAEKAKILKYEFENHDFLSSAPVSLSLPFSTIVRGEVDKNAIWKCREGIEETLDRLPEAISSKLKVLMLNFESGERGLADSNTVILSCDVERSERLRVFLHEMGHVVFLSSSVELQNEYKKLWEKSGEGDFVSGYAKENEFEDFAESFLAFVEFGKSFRTARSVVLEEKYVFIEQNFFPDRVYNGEREDFRSTFDMTKL